MVALSSFRDQSRICARRMRDRRVRRALMSLNTRGCGDPGLTRATYSRPRVGALRPEIPLGHGPAFGAGPVRRTGDINEPHSKAWNWLGRVRIRGPASANSATGPTNDQGSCRVSGWWVWVARSEGFRCDGWSASSHPARARSLRHHGSHRSGQSLGPAGRRHVLCLRAPTPLARGHALPRLWQRCGDPQRVRRHAAVPAALSM